MRITTRKSLTVAIPAGFRVVIFCLGLLCCCGQIQAQTGNHTPHTLFGWKQPPGPCCDLGDIVTDRPDFTEASSTVGAGVTQLEAGYTYTTDRSGGQQTSSHSWGEPLLRVGVIANWLEFRVATFPITQQQSGTVNQNDSGTEDMYLGFKIGLTPQEDWLPETALIPQMTVPTGAGSLSAGQVLPGVNYLYSWELTERMSLAGSTQFNSAIDDSSKLYTEWAQSIAIGRSLTDTLGVYTEWYALMPDNADTARTEHYLNGGFAILLSDDVQFDVRAGMGLNEAADDLFVGTGLSLRFH